MAAHHLPTAPLPLYLVYDSGVAARNQMLNCKPGQFSSWFVICVINYHFSGSYPPPLYTCYLPFQHLLRSSVSVFSWWETKPRKFNFSVVLFFECLEGISLATVERGWDPMALFLHSNPILGTTPKHDPYPPKSYIYSDHRTIDWVSRYGHKLELTALNLVPLSYPCKQGEHCPFAPDCGQLMDPHFPITCVQ